MSKEATGRELDFRRLYELHERQRYLARKRQMRVQKFRDWLGMVISALMLMIIGMLTGHIRAGDTNPPCEACTMEVSDVAEAQSR